MSKVTVTYKIKAKKRTPEKKPGAPSPVAESGSPRPVSRAARMPALAHYVERLVATVDDASGEPRPLPGTPHRQGTTKRP